MKVYVHKDGKQYGPYPIEQLRQYVEAGNFTLEDLACHDGQNWVKIGEVPGFAVPIPDASPSQTVPSRNQVVQRKAVKQQPAPANAVDSSSNKKKIILWSSIGGIAALLVTGLSIWLLGGDEARPESNGSAAPTDAKPVPAREIDLEDLGTRQKIALDKIIAEAIDDSRLEWRGKEGEELYYASPHSPHSPHSGPAPIKLSEEIKQKPYSGASKSMHENGQIRFLNQYKDGKQEGLAFWWYENGQKAWKSTWEDGKQEGHFTAWYENGQKSHESTYKDGKLITAVAWKPNGEKCPVTNVVNGNGVLVRYNDDGMEDRRFFYQNGKRAF